MSADHTDRHARESIRNEPRFRHLREPGMHPMFNQDTSMLELATLAMERVRSMLADRPALGVMSPEELRVLRSAPTSWVSFESALDGAALSLLEVYAAQRRDEADPSTGGAA